MQKTKVTICPFLNLLNDRNLRFRFPNASNFCYKPKTPQPIDLGHQESSCLKDTHVKCPVYSNDEIKVLPEGILSKRLLKRYKVPIKEILFTILLVIGISILVVLNLRLQQNFDIEKKESTPSSSQNGEIVISNPVTYEENQDNDILQTLYDISPVFKTSLDRDKDESIQVTISNSIIPITGQSAQSLDKEFVFRYSFFSLEVKPTQATISNSRFPISGLSLQSLDRNFDSQNTFISIVADDKDF